MMHVFCRRWALACNALFILAIGIVLSSVANPGPVSAADKLSLVLQSQGESSLHSGRFHHRSNAQQWKPKETAIIVCDVWDYHHSLSANNRLDEFVGRLDDLLNVARKQGVTIIHSPSDCMPAYHDHPARQRAIATPQAENLPLGIANWCSALPSEKQAPYPIDQSDGGADDDLLSQSTWSKKLASIGRNPALPWQHQNIKIAIDSQSDYVSDRGDEVWNVLEDRGIKNVILAGVHVNMCVLGRPFGLRQMAQNGKNVVLIRDLTDAMYNPGSWPYVNHFTGNDRIISHIERFVCPTITSDQILGGKPFRFSHDDRPHVVIVIAEEPYHTAVTLSDFASRQLGQDFRVTVLHADDRNPNLVPGVEQIDDADVLILSVRRRVLAAEAMERIRNYVESGKPVIGLRTSSHAFSLRDGKPPEGHQDWPKFDAEVFGGNYQGSYPDELRSSIRPLEMKNTSHWANDVNGLPFVQGGHMYKTGPLKPGAVVIWEGTVTGHAAEPVAWTFTRSDGGKSFYVALGHPDDFQQPAFESLLKRSIYWAASRQVGTAPANPHGLTSQPQWMNVTIPCFSSPLPANADADRGAGVAWYRSVVFIPQRWCQDTELTLHTGLSQSGVEVAGFLNGKSLDLAGEGSWRIPRDAITGDEYNLLVLRVSQPIADWSTPPALVSDNGQLLLSLAGNWQLRKAADNESLVNMPLPAKFGGSADIVHIAEEPLWVARTVTRPGEFTPGIEGPACDREGNILAVNFQRQGTIGRVSPEGSGEVFVELPEGSIGNGIRFNAAGKFFVADYVKHQILQVDPVTRAVTVFAQNDAMNQPNDIAIADDGTLYASDPNWAASTGQVWRIDTDGATTLVADEMGTTNGIDISPDGKTLYVNESVQRNVWAFTIADDRSLTNKRLIRKFADHGFDGMRVDVDGNLYITRFGKGTVVKITPQGEILQEISVLGMRPSNLCFGGPDGRTVYVTEVESTRLVAFRVDRPGRSWQQNLTWSQTHKK